MAVVFVKEGEPIDSAIKRFKRKVSSEGIMKSYNISKLPPKERKKYKKFAMIRRISKKKKRIEKAIMRSADYKPGMDIE